MRSSTDAANFPRLVSRSAVEAAISKALSLYIGRGKQFSVKQASNGSGVPDRLIECAKCDPESGDFRPLSLCDLLSLSEFLGPEFTCEWLSEAKQGAFWLPETEDTPPGALAADNSEDNAAIARAAQDGKFDREEKIILRPVGVRMMARGAQLAAMGAAA